MSQNPEEEEKAKKLLKSGNIKALSKILVGQLGREDREKLRSKINATVYNEDEDKEICITETLSDKLAYVLGLDQNVLNEIVNRVTNNILNQDKKK